MNERRKRRRKEIVIFIAGIVFLIIFHFIDVIRESLDTQHSHVFLRSYFRLAENATHGKPDYSLSGQDIIKKKGDCDKFQYPDKKFAGTNKKILEIWRRWGKGQIKTPIPMFWEKNPSCCNRHLLICSDETIYYIPAKTLQTYMEKGEDEKDLSSFIHEKSTAIYFWDHEMSFIKHYYWKYLGGNID
jgi:hypothetical protein